MSPLSRRRMMLMMATAGLAGAASRPAFAFSELPGADTVRLQALHDSACGGTAAHKELVAEVEQTLGDKMSAAEKRQVVAHLTCPICGCPLAGLF